MEYYEEFFQIPYPLPKMDLIGLVEFAFAAMENWGLITYREERILIDPFKSSADTKQSVALTVAHEIAHQVKMLISQNSILMLVFIYRGLVI